jgi:hypothetical protein
MKRLALIALLALPSMAWAQELPVFPGGGVERAVYWARLAQGGCILARGQFYSMDTLVLSQHCVVIDSRSTFNFHAGATPLVIGFAFGATPPCIRPLLRQAFQGYEFTTLAGRDILRACPGRYRAYGR